MTIKASSPTSLRNDPGPQLDLGARNQVVRNASGLIVSVHSRMRSHGTHCAWKDLKFSSSTPPRAAVAALLALAAPIVIPRMSTSEPRGLDPGCTGSATWTLLAMTSDGLSIVTATMEEQWGRRRVEQRPLAGASVNARWVPLTRVHDVSFLVGGTRGRLVIPTRTRESLWAAALGSWALQLAGGEQISADG